MSEPVHLARRLTFAHQHLMWNFGDILDALDERLGDRPALIHGESVRTWAEFGERSNRLARSLLDLGLTTGDKVGFVLRNSTAYSELFAACVKARLVHVNVNYRYVDRELEHLLSITDCAVIVFDVDMSETVARIAPRLAPSVRYVMVGAADDHPEPAGALDFELMCGDGDGSALGIERSGDDLYFQCTGGTTGMPKAVMWRQHDRISLLGLATGASNSEHADLVVASAPRVALTACPMMHSTGLTTAYSTMATGGTLVTLTAKGFDPVELFDVVEATRVQSIAIVGDAFGRPMAEALDESPCRWDLSSVDVVRSAGVMWSAENKRALLRHMPGATMSDSLGSSEGSRLAGLVSGVDDEVETGRFELGAAATVLDENFQSVEPGSGVPGRLATTGHIPLGYYNDPERTAETFPEIEGVRHTIPGDWCVLEADGTVTLLGRGSTCVNTGGEKVYPEEVENALRRLDDVDDALVVGVPDERWGSAVAAVVEFRGPGMGDDELRDALRHDLAGYKLPRRVVAVDVVPRSPNGKPDYKAAAALFG